MPRIQITNEISVQLSRLRNAVTTSVDFNRAQQITFEGNRGFTALTAYRNAIRETGRLMRRYQEILERDTINCEQIVENARTRDQGFSQVIRAGIGS